VLAAAAACVLAGGCGPSWGLLVRPVPADRALEETAIARDEGLFVFDKIAVIDVEGILLNERSGGLWRSGENPVSLFVEKVDKAAADRHVKAVVVRINSPGGGVTASDIMYRRLKALRRRRPEVRIVAAIQDVGASGAYYVACAADTIVAHPTAVVGSIGVMIQTVSLAGTLRMAGITAEAVTSGPHKDLASPLKPLDEKDLAILQSIVDRHYERFVGVVAAGRKELAAEQVRQLADGRIYAASQAVGNGLVDRTGYMDDAIAAAKSLAGARRVRVVIYRRPWGYRPNAYAAGPPAQAAQINLLNVTAADLALLARPRFWYLWTGHSYGPR
jgi:protease-4